MNSIDLSYVPLITICISFAAMIVTYLNYRLNKTLTIKNHLHAEKVRTYRGLVNAISEMITLINKGNQLLFEKLSSGKASSKLIQYADQLDEKAIEIDKLIIESYMVVPDYIAQLMLNFSIYIHSPVPPLSELESFLEHLKTADEKLRELTEHLIEAFRKDIGTERINQKLPRL